MTKSNICLFATVLCLKMFTGARKKREMDWQLVASYFTVKATDIFAVYMYVAICYILFICSRYVSVHIVHRLSLSTQSKSSKTVFSVEDIEG